MPAGIAVIGSGLSSGSGTLGLDCPNCTHRHDYQDEERAEGVARIVYDCNESCLCRSEDFIAAKTKQEELDNAFKMGQQDAKNSLLRDTP